MHHRNDVTRSTPLRRLIRFPLIRIVLAIVVVLSVYTLAQFILRSVSASLGIANDSPWPLFIVLLEVLGALLGYYGYVRLTEQRPVTELALPYAPRELGMGLLVGLGLFSVTIVTIALLGAYTITGTNGWRVVLPALAAAVSAGVVEEFLFRAILFRITEEVVGTWIAVAVTAVIFGILHIITPLATFVGAIAIMLEAGVLLAAAYILTRRLWLAIGIHIAWNFAQGGIFGVNVSGNEAQGLLQGQPRGPAFLSGGAFGAEASLIAVLVCLVVGVGLLVRAHQSNEIIQPFWHRQRAYTPAPTSVG
ncbi:MAG: hypothetical protein GFH27_549281n24 [Chloroflexi bacterium AL-W]|nr:hypothetical protein [Chloroflexi bacterium AL-N1]NOK65910.1 hypothetical protein [Chloroflexi bacterium AL-N10]NOK72791.1 hypothetical protein [Chloroflexi bacterium AL-N5]NOK79688.1 hypothetical protein [Chloroflexi bacterium AL-W]NOK93013.1 hypothetical protein [Chloroflexi bacterium AL-N15]